MVFLLSLNHGYIHVNNIVETPYCGKYKTQKSADYLPKCGLVGLAAISRYGCNVRLIFSSSPFIKKQLYFSGNICVI
jgi:hypothetical protein